MSRLYIERFWCGIRIGGNILDSWTDDVTVMGAKVCGHLRPRWYATTDNIYSRLYLAGTYRADYDATRTKHGCRRRTGTRPLDTTDSARAIT